MTSRVSRTSTRNVSTKSVRQVTEQDTVKQITNIINQNNWQLLLYNSDIPKKLKPDVVRSVILQSGSNHDPRRLHSFFHWSERHMGTPLHDLDLLCFLVLSLCNSKFYGSASEVIERMVRNTNSNNKSVRDILNAIDVCYRQCTEFKCNGVVFDMLIDGFRNAGLLNEAVDVFSCDKIVEFRPSVLRCNALLRELLKGNKTELLFWEVCEKMNELKVGFNVYTYTMVINAYFKAKNVEEAKRVFLEMGEKGCGPNVVTYNVFIGGLCRMGQTDEAVEKKNRMLEMGLDPDSYTYVNLINGFCLENWDL